MKHIAGDEPRTIEIVQGDGCTLTDAKGKKYLDFLAGWCVANTGYKNPRVREALEREAKHGIYVPQIFNCPEWEVFSELITSIMPSKQLVKAFRCTSGSEAVEFAVKAARAATGKPTIVSIEGVYHGHTYGAASVGNACTSAMAPCVPNMVKIKMPHASFGAAPEKVIAEFEQLVRESDDIAAFLSEPVFTNAGAIIPPPDFMPKIQEICRANGILFIMDEVATGFGRTGKLFASEHAALEPDIVCLGKGMTGGYATMGACVVTEAVAKRAKHIPMYSTFGWVLTDVAAAKANIETIVGEKLWEHAAHIGAKLLAALKSLEKKAHVREVRGLGLLLGIDIGVPVVKLPDTIHAERLVSKAADEGLVIDTAGNTLFITPPLILSEAQMSEGAEILSRIV